VVDRADVQRHAQGGVEQHDGRDCTGGLPRICDRERRDGREHRDGQQGHTVLQRRGGTEVDARAEPLLVDPTGGDGQQCTE